MGNPDEGTLEAPVDGTVADSIDVDELDIDTLRVELRQARERLALHDGFDQVIAENVRRTREMLDAASDLRASAIGGLSADGRERVSAEVAGLHRMAESMSTAMSDLVDRISAIQASLESQDDVPLNDRLPHVDEGSPQSGSPESPHALDLIVHGVADAGAALSLQRSLRGQDGVEDVTPREYTEGILRLRVTVAAGVDPASLADRDTILGLEIIHRSPGVIECAALAPSAPTQPATV